MDTLSLAIRTASRPASLSATEVSALGSVGTAAADLASIQFGSPASLSTRFIHVRPLRGSLAAWAELGMEFEPRPGGSESTYWRGTTARVGVGLSDMGGPTRVSGGVVATRSFADSLGGRNLFSGGGTVLARAHVATLWGSRDDVLVGVAGSYFRPYSVEESDPSGRRFPVRDFAGASALVAWPLGGVLIAPAAALSRESSEVPTGTGVVRGSGWSLRSSLAIDVAIGGSISFTPEVGYTTGSVRLDVLTNVGTSTSGDPITERRSDTDPLSGWWVGVSWSAAF
jgi:hypothetical protein